MAPQRSFFFIIVVRIGEFRRLIFQNEQWRAGWVNNDREFADWIRPHLGMLMHISRAFTAPADQNDLMQELMLSTWKAMPAFRGDSSVRTFVYRVAHNRAVTWKRRANRQAFYKQQACLEMAVTCAEPQVAGDDQLNLLYAAIRQLPPTDRSLVLSSLEGISYAEMATLHGLSESNVGACLTRSRSRLVKLAAEMSDGL